MSTIPIYTHPERSHADIFWGEMAPCEHLVQIYQDEGIFMDILEDFVAGGLKWRHGVIVIATAAHLSVLEEQLRTRGLSLLIAKANEEYLPLEAEATLAKFLVKDWPDEDLFEQFITGLLARARGTEQRPVRAFGEMVAVMWGRGLSGATVRLEHLWQRFCEKETFPLFCAYPRSGFTQDAAASMQVICTAHSRILQ